MDNFNAPFNKFSYDITKNKNHPGDIHVCGMELNDRNYTYNPNENNGCYPDTPDGHKWRDCRIFDSSPNSCTTAEHGCVYSSANKRCTPLSPSSIVPVDGWGANDSWKYSAFVEAKEVATTQYKTYKHDESSNSTSGKDIKPYCITPPCGT